MVDIPDEMDETDEDELRRAEIDKQYRIALAAHKRYAAADVEDVVENVGLLRRNSPPGYAEAVDEVEDALAEALDADAVVLYGYWVDTIPLRPERPSAARRVELVWHDSSRGQCRVEGVRVVVQGQPVNDLVWRMPHAWCLLGAAQHGLSRMATFVESGVFDPDEQAFDLIRDLVVSAAKTVNASLACDILYDAFEDAPDTTLAEVMNRPLGDEEDVVGTAQLVRDAALDAMTASPAVYFPALLADAISEMVDGGVPAADLEDALRDIEDDDDDEDDD